MLTLSFNPDHITSALRPLLRRMQMSRLIRYPHDMTIAINDTGNVDILDNRLKVNDLFNNASSAFRCGNVTMIYESGLATYKIWSPFIENDKYRSGDDRYHTKKTKSEDKALALITEYIKPLDWDKLFTCYYRSGVSKHHDWVHEGNTAYERAVNAATGSMGLNIAPRMFEALVNERSYIGKFANSYLNSITSDEIVEAYTDLRDRQDESRKLVVAVYVHPTSDYCAIAANKGEYRYNPLAAASVHKYEELSENIQTGIALMRMTPPLSLTPRIGYRASDDIYYLYGN